MMKRKLVTLAALGLTGLLFILSPYLAPAAPPQSLQLSVIRVWLQDEEPAIARWLKMQARQYEKETGQRLYLRNASKEEMALAQSQSEGAIIPDLMVMQGLPQPLLYRGYALILRDDSSNPLTPSPTSLLFHRPTQSPGPSPAPPALPDFSALGAILTPAFLSPSLPGCIQSSDPLSAFSAGKAPAALLTAGQAAQLPFGYQAFALEQGEGLLAVSAEATSEKGQGFLSFLLDAQAQQALCQYGLYSSNPALLLYDTQDPIRAMIEESRNFSY